ncbi:MAG: hypothetical protein LBB26_02345 [Puniceicoccales bacterium]|jgi:hypothetical protein|nr:hypothetical protein [Puniceicoccales bacterium]
MKNTTIPAANTADITDGDWQLQMFQISGLTPGSKLEFSFPWEFPTFLRRASPLPERKPFKEYHQ